MIEDVLNNGESDPDRQRLLRKGLRRLFVAFVIIKQEHPEKFGGCHLDEEIAREVVENYLDDRNAYKTRRRMSPDSKIMRHKIAGLMAASVCKHKPLQRGLGFKGDGEQVRHNEIFAMWTGIAICAEEFAGGQSEIILAMTKSEQFCAWRSEFINLLHRKPDSAEAFVLIFHTLCMKFMPAVIENSGGE